MGCYLCDVDQIRSRVPDFKSEVIMKTYWKYLMCSFLLLYILPVRAQYFGRTKVNYVQFDFEVLESPHFEIYHYEPDQELMKYWARELETWYQMHRSILKDSFSTKNPIIIYDNHSHFQQTRTISSTVGVGTGGVTEALKNRVVIPFAMTYQQTHHVLGHELVHAFQYHMILSGDDTTTMNSLSNLPLWMVEGLAEYLSIGREDPFTAMWMRDAYLHDQIPALEKLINYSEFFPYRYGQAFWAFLAGMYGDEVIRPFFMATARWGLEIASQRILHMPFKDLSEMWQHRMKQFYKNQLDGRGEVITGRRMIDESNAGYMNVSPSLSPDGRYLVFFSEKDLFTVDLYLADMRTKKILGKIASAAKDRMIDDFQFMESSGSWSPNSRQFAFVAFHRGENVIIVKDAFSGKTADTYRVPEIPAITNPAWSPDGKTIVFTGMKNGQPDLYTLDLRTKKVTNLTNDAYSYLHPAWSPDGKYLVFATDKRSRQQGRTDGKWTFNLARYDVISKETVQLEIFPGANNLNPQFDDQGNIVFLSDRDGFRNMYRFHPDSNKVSQMTDLLTGISGITSYAPAISVNGSRGSQVVYTHFTDKKYRLYLADVADFPAVQVDPLATDQTPGRLPVVDPDINSIVSQNFAGLETAKPLVESRLKEKPYRAKFKLDFVGGGGGVGTGVGTTYGSGTYMSGGIDLLFGDMLGYHQLYTGLYLSGEIYDFGGVVSYLNQKRRVPWGISLSHIPYVGARSYYPEIDTFNNEYLALRYTYDLIRLFEDRASVYSFIPFNPSLRLEGGGAASRYSYRIDRYDNWYDAGGYLFAMSREKQDAPPGFNLYNAGVALVGDQSLYGIASPMSGYRFRIGLDHYFGEWIYQSILLDGRKYYWLKPVSLGFRFLHFARLGQDALRFYPYYVGDPYLVRGYGYRLERLLDYDLDYNQLGGSKIAVFNAELRLPFSGPKRLAVIPSDILFTELALFVDGGAAWDNWSDFERQEVDPQGTQHKVIFSSGLCLRLNLFGALVLEPYYAVPWQSNPKGVFGVNFLTSGW